MDKKTVKEIDVRELNSGNIIKFLFFSLGGRKQVVTDKISLPGGAEGEPSPLPSLDWKIMMEVGLGVFNLPPREFWEMTMYEYHAMLSVYGRKIQDLGNISPITRMELKEMMDKFPDQKK